MGVGLGSHLNGCLVGYLVVFQWVSDKGKRRKLWPGDVRLIMKFPQTGKKGGDVAGVGFIAPLGAGYLVLSQSDRPRLDSSSQH